MFGFGTSEEYILILPTSMLHWGSYLPLPLAEVDLRAQGIRMIRLGISNLQKKSCRDKYSFLSCKNDKSGVHGSWA